MDLRVWHLVVPLIVAVFVLGGAFAYMLGRGDGQSQPKTVVQVVHDGISEAIRIDTDNTAESNVRSAIPAAETYYQDTSESGGHDSYSGISGFLLREEAPGIAANVQAHAFNHGRAYCVEDQEDGGAPYHYLGGDPGQTRWPVGTIVRGTCPV